MGLLIDTSVVAPDERAEFWARSSSVAYHPLQIRTDASERFAGRMSLEQLEPLRFYRLTAAPNTMFRSRREVMEGDPDCLHLTVLLRGRLEGAQYGREILLGPGDMCSYDTSAPVIFRAPEWFEVLVLRLPKTALEDDAPRMVRFAGVAISGSARFPRVVASYLRRTALALADGSLASRDVRRAERVCELVRSLYRSLDGAERAGRARSRAELLLQAQSYIEANLRDRRLNPEQVARACFVSTRYLQRVFEERGLSVAAWIRAARLERCRRDLLDPALADRSINEIASGWGFTSAQHFSRLFRATYGCCARELRAGPAAARRCA